MTLKTYIAKLQKVAKWNPEALDLPVCYSIDPEGNGYYLVQYSPSTGKLDKFGEFESTEDAKCTHICIN